MKNLQEDDELSIYRHEKALNKRIAVQLVKRTYDCR